MGAYAVQVRRLPPVRLEPHRDHPGSDGWVEWVKSQGRPVAVDLFSGAGGLSLGLEEAGYRVVLAVDTDPWALETHRANFPGEAVDADLGDPNIVESVIARLQGLDVALIAGGPPCQPFSRAGRSKIRSLVEKGRDPNDPRRELWRAFLRVVEEVGPQAVLLENVPDLALGDDVTVVRLMTARLEELGYEAYWRIVEAWQHGVPQHRQRFILVATKNAGAFRWPAAEARVDLRDAIGDLPRLGDTTGELELRYKGEPATDFQRAARATMVLEAREVVWDHHTRAVRPDDREAFEQMTAKTRYSDLPEHLRRYRDDIFDDKYKRLGWNELSRSITAHIAKDGYWYIHPEEHRTITVREAARIQTFPDSYRFAGSRSHVFRQIGNAVPPKLAEVIGRKVLNALQSRPEQAEQRWSRRLRIARQALLDWTADDRVSAPWRYPGDPWAVLVGRLIAPRADEIEAVDGFLARWPDPASWLQDRDRLRRLGEVGVRAAARVCVTADRVARVVCEGGWRDGDVALELTPADKSWLLGIGLADGSLVSSAGVLRVLARWFGDATIDSRRGTDGRLALARFIGVESAAELNAGLYGLARSVCSPAAPACERCPVAASCRAASSGDDA